jgi:hypothetical protein
MTKPQPPNTIKAIIIVAPQKKKEYGFLEGWGFQPGDQILLTHPNYATLNFRIPALKT